MSRGALPVRSLSLKGHVPFLPSLLMDALFPVEGLTALAWWCRKLLSSWADQGSNFLSQCVFLLHLSFGSVVQKRLCFFSS